MKTLLAKLRTMERELSSERGDFDFFGLLLRDESPGKWDFVVAAPWLDHEKRRSIKLIDDELNDRLSLEEKVMLSRIVVLDPKGPMLDALLEHFSVRHGLEESRDESFMSMQFERMYVISAGRSGTREATKVS